MSRHFNFSCDKFLGLNYDRSCENNLLSGESPDMVNLTVTESYKLKKRGGYTVLNRMEGEGRGMWCGELDGKEAVVFIVGDKVFTRNGDGDAVETGNLESTSGQVDFLRFSNKLYLLDGVKIKIWDGNVLSDITPYRPLVAVSTTPNGAGTAFEEKNFLTGMMRQSFTMNSTTTTLQLAVTNLDSIDYVSISGQNLSKSKYTYNLEKGTVSIPTDYSDYSVIDGIEVGFTKSDGHENDIHRMRHAVLYGKENDTRIFMWGDSEEPALLRYSGVYGGISGMEYFPENAFNRVGTKNEVTSVIRHFDRLIIFCRSEAFYSYMETVSDENGLEYEIFPIRPLSDNIGSMSEYSVLVDNFPITLDRGTLYRWKSTSVRDERYAEDIGGRIKAGLKEWDFKKAKLFDSEQDELYIQYNDSIYVYNYRLDVFYLWQGFNAVSFGRRSSGEMLFQRSDGSLCQMTDRPLDDSEAINAQWSTSYLHLAEGVKNLQRIELEIVPETNSIAEVSWVSDHSETGRCRFTERYRCFSFESLSFAKLGFMTGLAEKRFSMRIKHKRFEKLKLRLENSYPDSALHISSFNLYGTVTDKKSGR